MDICKGEPGGIEDRRQVAERLRKHESEWVQFIDYTADEDMSEILNDIADALGLDLSECSGNGLLCRLADLIEPLMCRNTATDDGLSGSDFQCSRCGLAWSFDVGDLDENEFYHCPKCGAEVIR